MLRTLLLLLTLGCSLVRADVVFNPNGNANINNSISRMLTQAMPYPLSTQYTSCKNEPNAVNCQVQIMANGGIHQSNTDPTLHFTVRFAGAQALYEACHFYPNAAQDALTGVQCYDLNHAPAPYCSYSKMKCG
jgi:hypothetical protein